MFTTLCKKQQLIYLKYRVKPSFTNAFCSLLMKFSSTKCSVALQNPSVDTCLLLIDQMKTFGARLIFDLRIIRRMCESMLSTNAEIALMDCCLGDPDCLAALCFFLKQTGAHNMPRGHSITKHTGGGGWLEGLSQKPQNIFPKIAILKKC